LGLINALRVAKNFAASTARQVGSATLKLNEKIIYRIGV